MAKPSPLEALPRRSLFRDVAPLIKPASPSIFRPSDKPIKGEGKESESGEGNGAGKVESLSPPSATKPSGKPESAQSLAGKAKEPNNAQAASVDAKTRGPTYPAPPGPEKSLTGEGAPLANASLANAPLANRTRDGHVRDKRNAYMADYMRRRRAGLKPSNIGLKAAPP
jgi:hypothetical protein